MQKFEKLTILLGSSAGTFLVERQAEGYRARKLAPLLPERKGEDPEGFGIPLSRSPGAPHSVPHPVSTIRGVFARDCIKPNRFYVASSTAGLFRSDDQGRSWTCLTEGLEFQSAWSIAQHPKSGDLYLGTEPAAVFKSQNDGLSWKKCGSLERLPRYREWTFPRAPFKPHIKSILLHSEEPELVYCAVEEGWVIRSRDGGMTWENLIRGMEFDAHFVARDPFDARTLFATSGNGFYRSENSGDLFVRSDAGLDRSYLSPLVMSSDSALSLYVCASTFTPDKWFVAGRGADSAFYRSDDRGQSWKELTGTPHLSGGCWAASGHPDCPGVFCAGLSDGSVWLTRDGGARFETVAQGLGLISAITLLDGFV